MQGGTAGSAAKSSGAWTAFLIVAFGVVGLIGAFATIAAQIPMERMLARDHTLSLLAAAPNDAARAALRDLMGDSADRLITPAGAAKAVDFPAAIAAERTRTLHDLGVEGADIGLRLRIVIAVFTAAGALFGAMVLGIVRRSAGR